MTGLVVVSAGCELFPPTPPPSVQVKGAATKLTDIAGGALGAAGGYVVGASTETLARTDLREAAIASSLGGETNPADASGREITTPDLNADGFITLDEILALHRVGLSDDTIIEKLGQSQYVLGATRPQGEYLVGFGVGPVVVQFLMFHSAPADKTKN